MQRSPIIDGFGKVEEGLDRLESLALMNGAAELCRESSFEHSWSALLSEVRDQLEDLEDTVHERVVRNKGMQAMDLLSKVVRLTLNECESLDMDPAFVLTANGRVTMDLVELSMASIMACLKVAVSSFKKQTSVSRMLKHLFPTCTFQMELKASNTEVHFVLLTDGDQAVFSTSAFGTEAIRAVRESVAKQGGLFSFRALPAYGGRIEFRIPMIRVRRPAMLLRSGSSEVLLHTVCISRVIGDAASLELATTKKNGIARTVDGAMVCRISATEGLVPVSSQEISALAGAKAVVAGVADFQFVILADETTAIDKMRMIEDRELMDKESWFNVLGTYQQGTLLKLSPVVDGPVLMNAWRRYGVEK